MKINYYISYFYNIRFFPGDIIPISTAISDPAWFKREEPEEDSRGVILGIRFPELSHPSAYECGCPCITKNPGECKFIKTYEDHLERLDWELLKEKLEKLAIYLESCGKKVSGFCFMVYEAPNNPCSERPSLIKYFKKNGIFLNEFDKKGLV